VEVSIGKGQGSVFNKRDHREGKGGRKVSKKMRKEGVVFTRGGGTEKNGGASGTTNIEKKKRQKEANVEQNYWGGGGGSRWYLVGGELRSGGRFWNIQSGSLGIPGCDRK